jgi:hypothetical protein
VYFSPFDATVFPSSCSLQRTPEDAELMFIRVKMNDRADLAATVKGTVQREMLRRGGITTGRTIIASFSLLLKDILGQAPETLFFIIKYTLLM